MRGFFSSNEIKSTINPSGKPLSCASCGLYKNCDSPKMKPFGNFKKGILNIGEAPDEVEDRKGRQWQGKAGKLLQRTYQNLGIDLFDDCLNINAVNCHPKNNKIPTSYQIDCCRSVIVSKIIKEYMPKIIIVFGDSALYSIIGYRWKKDLDTIFKWRGFQIPDQDYKCWICPTFHPSYVEKEDQQVQTVWEQDLQQALSKLDESFPKMKKPDIRIIKDLNPLRELSGVVAIDYETTGLKPHASGHRIICAAVSYKDNKCFSFMIPKTRKERQPFIDLIASKTIGKMAHNMKFEEAWSVHRLKQSVGFWEWDSMLAAHVIDNRPKISSLKFQTYVNFGVIDYDSEVSPYLKSVDGKNGNSMNKVEELIKTEKGTNQLLTYCGLDTIYQYKLAMIQMNQLGYDFLPF
ncbi:MAG: uracil-DNA glycosylase family protein [Thiohalospira sp.]